MDYSLRELECFVAVAEELSFTRAARRLHLAQPPLSRHIRVLEEKIGAPLFERSQKGVALTAAGAVFQDETKGILPQLLRAGEAVRRQVQGETARLRLGFVSAVLSEKLVETFRRFRQLHPQVQVMLHDMPPAEQWLGIMQGTLDGGFVGLMPDEKDRPAGMQHVPWREEPLVAFVPSGHRLGPSGSNSSRKPISIKEFAREPFVAVSSEAAPVFASLLRELCSAAGFRPRIVLESPRAQAVAVMVAAGSGVAFLPESLAHVLGGSVEVVRLREAPVITHVFAHPAGGSTTPAMKAFLELLSSD
ncbi:LysR substrate-binding domain-containing protein [Verrucomicrobium sp. BvORR106]|uniref:LysR family transcriptional regulator n=1 Tax=Verrucomicrobium sp. BvORR106 TaxID=1403819 RepID=UPI00056F7BA6|nr:LysR substrate-binding domain-containing protein [Verrucomicrobium sp. BvORR106]